MPLQLSVVEIYTLFCSVHAAFIVITTGNSVVKVKPQTSVYYLCLYYLAWDCPMTSHFVNINFI